MQTSLQRLHPHHVLEKQTNMLAEISEDHGRMYCRKGFLGQDLLQSHLKNPETVKTGLICYSFIPPVFSKSCKVHLVAKQK